MISAAIVSMSLFAASAISVDAERHSVTISTTATGVEKGAPVEFLLAGPDSDRDYESVFFSDAGASEIASAFEQAGIPSGSPVDFSTCKFWPVGRRLSINPRIWDFVEDKSADSTYLPVIYTGGSREGDGTPTAESKMPCAIFALYSCPQSLLQLDDSLDQSATYGTFVAASTLEKGTKAKFTFTWDGTSGACPCAVRFEPGNLRDAIEMLKSAVKGEDGIDATVSFSEELTASEATAIANALSVIDSRLVRVNHCEEGQFFFRAFLPLETWRDRRERLAQPLELKVSATNIVCTIVDEDWSGDGVDPLLSPRIVDFDEARRAKTDTCFIFTSGDMKLSRLYGIKAKFPNSFKNWYVYID